MEDQIKLAKEELAKLNGGTLEISDSDFEDWYTVHLGGRPSQKDRD